MFRSGLVRGSLVALCVVLLAVSVSGCRTHRGKEDKKVTPEALYKAAWRYSALIEIYKTSNDTKRVADSTARAIATAKRIVSQFPDNTDWSTRAQRLLYMVQNNIPTFGNMVE